MKFSCSIVALSTALLIFDFEILKYIESSSYNLDFNFSLLFKLKNGFMYVIDEEPFLKNPTGKPIIINYFYHEKIRQLSKNK